jgi:hypothetical protein
VRRPNRRIAISEVELRRLYCDLGLSTLSIAKQLGCSEGVVRRRLAAYGIARRTPWKSVECDRDDVIRMYVEQGLPSSAIARRVGCSSATILRRLKAVGVDRRASGGALRYPRRDFSGDPFERAYLIGFRLGDLHVAAGRDTVLVKCTSTRQEQVTLFRSLFEPYGHIYTSEASPAHGQRPSVRMEARLNRSFDFLVQKEDLVPDRILADDELFFAFLAGYMDAEGYVKTRPKGYRTLEVRVEIRSYERRVLQALGQGLNARGIVCPDAKRRVAAGYTNGYGIKCNKDTWGLGIGRTDALLRLFTRIDPYVRHAGRRRDMQRAWTVLRDRMTSPSTVRRLRVSVEARRQAPAKGP